ncbi:MAG: hypothetical protein K1X61_13930 [Chitinophagales bacterium]|nr:hypothetical protein [Chitinophagales bacterium]
MSLHKKINVVDLATLLSEQQRLKAVCEVKKVRVEQGLAQLKKNYPEVIFKTILPFDDKTNGMIYNGAKWISGKIGNFAAGSQSQAVKLIAGKGGNLLQGVLIFVLLRIIRKVVEKR